MKYIRFVGKLVIVCVVLTTLTAQNLLFYSFACFAVEVMDCNEVWPEPSTVWRRSYTFFLLATTYLLPLCLLSLTYGLVG